MARQNCEVLLKYISKIIPMHLVLNATGHQVMILFFFFLQLEHVTALPVTLQNCKNCLNSEIEGAGKNELGCDAMGISEKPPDSNI